MYLSIAASCVPRRDSLLFMVIQSLLNINQLPIVRKFCKFAFWNPKHQLLFKCHLLTLTCNGIYCFSWPACTCSPDSCKKCQFSEECENYLRKHHKLAHKTSLAASNHGGIATQLSTLKLSLWTWSNIIDLLGPLVKRSNKND